MRANLADFNVTIHEVYDPQITTVDLIPQDFSRAIINLMNNACYAVWKKQQDNPPSDYVPTVTVQTALSADWVCVTIEDNELYSVTGIYEIIIEVTEKKENEQTTASDENEKTTDTEVTTEAESE